MTRTGAIIVTLTLVACQTTDGGATTAAAKSEPTLAAADLHADVPRDVPTGKGPFSKPGFVTLVDDGRLWVFDSEQRPERSEKHITVVGAGPAGMTLKALDSGTAYAFVAAKPGFETEIEDGRIWVWRAGEPRERSDKHVTLVGAGPCNMTVKALEKETALAYVATKPGFEVEIEDGRVWVWRAGEEHERSDKHATIIAGAPGRMTVKALEYDTALAYVATKPGYEVAVEDGRIWVWREGSPHEMSEKCVTRVAAGPLGKTLRALDREVLEGYLRVPQP